MPEMRIGISGWNYPPWRGNFYPKGLVQKRELEYASRQVNSIEINGSFYSLQHPTSYHAWYQNTPDDFVFSVKGGRFITHIKRLREIEAPLANFFASGLLRLKQKLGPILWQFPPSFQFDEPRIEAFFKLLPRDTKEAAALARKHDDAVKDRAWTRTDENRPMRHAMEVRHPSFENEQFIALLRKYNVAMVVADTAGKWPLIEDVTSDFIYVRLHGDEQIYVSGYTDEALEEWARKIRGWAAGQTPERTRLFAAPAKVAKGGRAIYVYFDNDVKVRAPYDAMSLAHKLGLGPPPEAGPDPDTIAEGPRPRWPEFPRRWEKASAPAANLTPTRVAKAQVRTVGSRR